MKNALLFTLGFSAATLLVSANAQTYQWKDASGRTVISDTPPPKAARVNKTVGTPAASNEFKTNEEVKAATEKSIADREQEFKKRQQEAKEKAEKAAKEQAAAREKQENCDRTRRNLTLLESEQGINMPGENGERQLINTEQRQQEMERARKYLSENCSK